MDGCHMSDRPIALITGAARGIGAATTRRLVADGWSVVAVDSCRDEPTLPYPLATPQDLEDVGSIDPDHIATAVADVRDSAALSRAVALAESRFGGLDAAIACAGVIAGGVEQWLVPQGQEDALLD